RPILVASRPRRQVFVKIARHAKPDVTDTKIGGIGGACRRADLIGSLKPCATAHHVPGAVGLLCSGVVGGAILGPLPHVSEHVVETETVACEASNRRGEPPAVAPADRGTAALVRSVIGVVAVDRVAPWPGRGGAGTRGIFPFGFARQAIDVA